MRFHAKRKGGQVIENKQSCEMVHFAPPMISTTYDQRRETARFAGRKESLRFAGFSASSRPKTQGTNSAVDSGLAWRLRESTTRNAPQQARTKSGGEHPRPAQSSGRSPGRESEPQAFAAQGARLGLSRRFARGGRRDRAAEIGLSRGPPVDDRAGFGRRISAG